MNKSPGSLRAHINLGVAYDIEGDPERALEVYERGASSAFEEDSKAWSSLYCCMGIAYGNLAKIPEARRYMELSANTVPLADCLLNLANLQLVQLDLSNAEQTLNQLERMSPRHAKLRLLRAKLFLATGRIELARSELTEELRLHPETEEARQMLSDLDQH